MNVTSKYILAMCVVAGLASATPAAATTINVSPFSRQFVGIDLAKATILSDADA